MSKQMTEATPVSNNKPAWDRRAWMVGLITSVPTSAFFSFDMFWNSKSSGVYEAASGFCAIVIFLLGPSVLAAISRRRWLCWSYLPFIVFVLVMIISGFAMIFFEPSTAISAGGSSTALGSAAGDPPGKIDILMASLFPLASGLPVVLTRLYIQSARRRHASRLLQVELTANEPMVIDAWPPRPKVE